MTTHISLKETTHCKRQCLAVADEISNLREKLLSILDGKSQPHDFCRSHRECSKKIRLINELLLPTDSDDPTDQKFYQRVAECILLKDDLKDEVEEGIIKPSEEEKQQAWADYEKSEKNAIKMLAEYEFWRKNIVDTYEERKKITNDELLRMLRQEIGDENVKKNLYWLIKWSFRFALATDNPKWKDWKMSDSTGIFNFSRFIRYSHAAKDPRAFDLIFDNALCRLLHTTASLEILNNTVLRETGVGVRDSMIPHIVSRLFPFPIPLTTMDILELQDCGFFPLGIIARKIIQVDGFVMPGLENVIHDLVHGINILSGSQTYVSSEIINPIDACYRLSFFWHNYNNFISDCVDFANQGHFNKLEIGLLFDLVHELFAPAMLKCAQIINPKLERYITLRTAAVERYNNIMHGKMCKIRIPIIEQCEQFIEKLRKIFFNNQTNNTLYSLFPIGTNDGAGFFPDSVEYLTYVKLGVNLGWNNNHTLSDCQTDDSMGTYLTNALTIKNNQDIERRFYGMVMNHIDQYNPSKKRSMDEPVSSRRKVKFFRVKYMATE